MLMPFAENMFVGLLSVKECPIEVFISRNNDRVGVGRDQRLGIVGVRVPSQMYCVVVVLQIRSCSLGSAVNMRSPAQ